MDVFSKYFRRLVSGNAAQIFPGSKNDGNSGSYQLLVDEMNKILRDPAQASKIVEAIETADGDIFRDFDLTTFIEHFHQDPIVDGVVALAFTQSSRADLRHKASSYFSQISSNFLRSLTIPRDSTKELNPTVLATFVESLVANPPVGLGEEFKVQLIASIRHRYNELMDDIPEDLSSALQLLSISSSALALLRPLQKAGSRATASPETVDELLNSIDMASLSPEDVSTALLLTSLSSNFKSFNTNLFVNVIRSRLPTLNWQAVIEGFDQRGLGATGLQIESRQLATLINALLPVAEENENVDIQAMWGGKWRNPNTQLSFLKAFLFMNHGDVDILNIPGFRMSFSPELFAGASESIIAQAEAATKTTFNSLDAVTAVLDIVSEANAAEVRKILEHDLATFVVSAARVPGDWNPLQHALMTMSFNYFLMKMNDSYTFALDGAWRQNQVWVINCLVDAFSQDPMQTEPILDLAQELGWTDELLTLNSPFALDLACLLHKRDNIDFDNWLRKFADRQGDIGTFLIKYLRIKADDEIRVQRKEQPAPRSVSLAVKTVFSLLLTAEDFVTDEEILMPMQRMCLATYPRLVNFGEGFDDMIEANGMNGNALPEETDKQMQDLFGKMYREEAPIREILELMRRYKTSHDQGEQDLFACIVHGLFDEYHCYHEYPADALMKTAVMFGGIINFRLISGIPMKVGLGLILDAVREHEPHESMFKFGVEAIEQLTSRLPEWVGFCSLLAQIPTLANTPIAQRAQEILLEQGRNATADNATNGINGHQRDAFDMGSGSGDIPTMNTLRSFRSLHIDPPRSGRFADPPEDIQEKVLFTLNNISKDNFEEKLHELQGSLKEEYYQWFAGYLVEQRVKLEPNYQALYLEVLDVIGNKTLFDEVLRETYVSSIRMINSESTINSSPDRALLRNLGGWLGLITIARDKPIKHKNIYFKELLIEGWQTQRLIVVLPFTCRVLLQAAHSKVFKPPNPWLMDIIGLLLELYGRDIKLNLKFEIEVLCKDLKLDLKTLKASTSLQELEEQSLQVEDELAQSTLQEYSDLGDDLGINGIGRTLRSERLSPATLMSNLPNLEAILTYPTLGNVLDQAVVKDIVTTAFSRAIAEIIGPVVERSITIASIATAQSVAKDFAMEADEEKLRSSARQMVKSLAGSLALVTCKEPLRMSITNYMRRPPEQSEHENFLPEGVIMICLNDNLDKACSYIEKAAEEKSVSEIDRHIEGQIEARRRHKATQANAPFVDPAHFNRWSTCIPEPYRQNPGGLNEQQLSVYKDFAPQARGVGPNHVANNSTDSTSRAMADVLQEPFTTMPNLSTPAEQPAMPHQTPLPQQEPRVQPALGNSTQPHINGYIDAANPQDKIQTLLSDMSGECKDTSVDHVKDLPRDSIIFTDFHKLLQLLTSSTRTTGETLARFIAEKICTTIFADLDNQLEIELMAHLLAKICSLSEAVSRDVFRWMTSQEDGHIFNIPVTIALIDAGLIEFSRIDFILTKTIAQKKPQALQLLSELMDQVLFCEEPTALRADFSSSLDAMNAWLAEEPDLPLAAEINNKLRATGVPETVKPVLTDEMRAKQDQMEYIFTEWVSLYQNPAANERMYATFMKDMHQKQTINNQEDSAMFLRLCIDACVAAFEQEAQNLMGNLSDAYLETDALAKLVILLIKLQGESNGAVKSKKATYLKSMLSLIVLVENHHQVMRGERFNQRVFYRLFSSILCEYTINGLHRTNDHQDMMIVFAEIFLALQPLYIPGFAYGWLSLISHRVFLPGILNIAEEAGWGLYAQLIKALLLYMSEQLKPAQISLVSQDLYRGCLRVLLILHHDFPEFMAENHFRLVAVLPAHCTQLRNLILSAYPSSLQELPDPFSGGLKVDRLPEMTKTPRVAGNIVAPIEDANLKALIDGVLHGQSNVDDALGQISEAISSPKIKETGLLFEPVNFDIVLLNALVIYIGQDAVTGSGNKSGRKNEAGAFDKSSPHVLLLEKLCKAVDAEGRYHLVNAIANQLRYPNSLTHYFSYVTLHLFGMEYIDQQDTEIRQQIVRVILERLIVHRPHPWGLLIVLLELDHNTAYRFWDLPFIAAAPEVGSPQFLSKSTC
ncbi:putative ccr4-not transcription complex subunit [Phaeomoniella chlamydospora]|uniref:General negative regulator of transcription subunit 1 n=1 Tax=Phaeomoniella chlamydospora TaxID=158046 RepID=A0A0G2EXC5_PHACM|nr:putative ccr4-not transcription complex subunit [Phaeomoniella chlamydospora]